MSDATTNDVITDSVTQTNTLLTGMAAPHGMALVDITSAETMGMAMHNAISAQQNAQLTTNASVTATCAKMLSIGPPISAASSSVKNDAPPPFMPLSGNGAEDLAKADVNQLLSMANSLADSAVSELKNQNVSDTDTKKTIQDLITKLQGLDTSSTTTANHEKDSATTTNHTDDKTAPAEHNAGGSGSG